jgi:hypothetical protein
VNFSAKGGDGLVATASGGGGAGGSMVINTDILSGLSSNFSADGGSGGGSSGGAGGGGTFFLKYCEDDVSPPSVSAPTPVKGASGGTTGAGDGKEYIPACAVSGST